MSHPLVLMFCCGAGSHEDRLASKLANRGCRVQRLQRTWNDIDTLDRAARVVEECEGPIVLHGWSLGGRLVLEFLMSCPSVSEKIIGAVVCASEVILSSDPLSRIDIPVLMCHNSFDSLVPIWVSEYLCTSINKSGRRNAVLKILDAYSGEFSSHHQPDDFDDISVSWILTLVGA